MLYWKLKKGLDFAIEVTFIFFFYYAVAGDHYTSVQTTFEEEKCYCDSKEECLVKCLDDDQR